MMCIKCQVRRVTKKRQDEGKKLCGNCASEIRTNIIRKGVSRKTGEVLPTHAICACGKEYELTRTNKKSCSDECNEKRIKEYNKEYGAKYRTPKRKALKNLKRRTINVKICLTCNKEFTAYGKAVYCSNECKYERQKMQSRESSRRRSKKQ